MYNNRIILIYILLIAICFNISTSSRILDHKLHTVCTALPKTSNLPPKNNLPPLESLKSRGNFLILNNCSIYSEIKHKLNDLGVDSSLLLEIKDKQEREDTIKSILDFIDHVYKQNGYFNSYVVSHKYLDTGQLLVECVENQIPESNFRLFLKDQKSNKVISLKEGNVIKMSSNSLPTGNYTQIPNEYLVKKLYRGKTMIRLEPKCLDSIRATGLYKNLEYVVHKEGDEVFLDFFFDGYGVIHSVAPTLTVPPGGLVLNMVYQNINLLDTRSVLKLIAELNLFKLLEYNHKFRITLFSDVLDLSFWNNGCSNPSLFSVYTLFTRNDLMHLLTTVTKSKVIKTVKSKFTPKTKTKTPTNLKSLKESGTAKLENLKDATANQLERLKDVTSHNLEKLKVSNKKEGFKDFQLCVRFLRVYGDLKSIFSTALGVADLTFTNDLSYKLETELLKDPVNITASLMNKFRYRGFDDSPRPPAPNYRFRAQTTVDMTLNSKHKLYTKYLYGNEMAAGDYRGLDDNLLTKPFLLLAHDILLPLTFKFKIVPYAGVFLDLLFPSDKKSTSDLDLSLGLKLKIFNLAVSIPLIVKLNSTFVFNNFSKKMRKFHVTV